jgi:ELWxxDGT repeat protein
MKSLAVCCLLVLLALPAMALESFLVKDINPGPPDSDPRDLATLDGAVVFFAAGGLWRSDGTGGGSWLLTEHALEPVRATGRLYFFVNEHRVLSVSDGTVGGTFELAGLEVTIEGRGISSLSLWVPSQGVLYFIAHDSDRGSELWRSDGTVAGTRLVADIRPGAEGSNVEWLTEHKGRIWFAADDGQHGGALWHTDGTPAGTVLAIDPVPSSDSHPGPEHIRSVGDRLAFFAPTDQGTRLWAGDGTVQGTAPIRGFRALRDSTVRGNRLWFVAEDEGGQELWVSDGTRRGTRTLTSLQEHHAFENAGFPFQQEKDVNGRYLFWAAEGTRGVEPWITDGTRQGTRLLRDICPGPCWSGPGNVWPVLGGRLYFIAENPGRGQELWSTDGRSARFVKDICPGSCGSGPYAPFVLGGRLFFVARDGQTGEEIWSTNGTAAGTVRVTDFEPSFIWAEDGFHGAVVNGKLLFGAPDSEHGMELWAIEP